MVEVTEGPTAGSVEKLLNDELAKWHRKPKAATDVLILGYVWALKYSWTSQRHKSLTTGTTSSSSNQSPSFQSKTKLETGGLRNALAESGHATTALHVLKTMTRREAARTPQAVHNLSSFIMIYNLMPPLLGHCCIHTPCREGGMLFLKKSPPHRICQVPINIFHFNVAIKAARRSKDWRMACQLLEAAAGMMLGRLNKNATAIYWLSQAIYWNCQSTIWYRTRDQGSWVDLPLCMHEESGPWPHFLQLSDQRLQHAERLAHRFEPFGWDEGFIFKAKWSPALDAVWLRLFQLWHNDTKCINMYITP